MTAGEAVATDRRDRQALDDWNIRHKRLPCDCLEGAQRIARPIVAAERLNSRNLFYALRGLATAMKPIPGLKSIGLVSEGVLTDRDTLDDMRRFSEAAAATRVTRYSPRSTSPSSGSQTTSGPRTPLKSRSTRLPLRRHCGRLIWRRRPS